MKNEIRNRLTELADRLGDSATFMTSEVLNSLRVPESETINSEADDIALSDHAAREGFAMADSDLPGYERAARARGLLRGLDASFDIIVLTLEEWQRQLKSGVSLANTVADEGVLLYDSQV